MISRIGTRRVWIFLLSVLVLGYAGLAWRNRDVQRISRRLEKLCALFNKQAGESPLTSMTRARELGAAFIGNPQVRLGPYLPAFFDRDELTASIHQGRSVFDEIRMSILDKAIHIAENRRSATSELSVEGTLVFQGDLERRIFDFRVWWTNEKGQWLIEAAEPLEVIKPPQRIRNAVRSSASGEPL